MAKEPTFKEKVIAVLDEQIKTEEDRVHSLLSKRNEIMAKTEASNLTIDTLRNAKQQIMEMKQRDTNSTTKEED